jgi:hypothetical protein
LEQAVSVTTRLLELADSVVPSILRHTNVSPAMAARPFAYPEIHMVEQNRLWRTSVLALPRVVGAKVPAVALGVTNRVVAPAALACSMRPPVPSTTNRASKLDASTRTRIAALASR